MKKEKSLERNAGKNNSACLTLMGRCFPGKLYLDSDSEGETFQEDKLNNASVDSSQELSPDLQKQEEIVVEANEVKEQLVENASLTAASSKSGPIKTSDIKTLNRQLSVSAKEVLDKSIEDVSRTFKINDNIKQFLTQNTHDLFNLTGLLEAETKKFLGLQDEELKSDVGSEDDKSAELTPRLSEVYSQESAGVVGQQSLASEPRIQASTVTSPPNGQVLHPQAQTILSVALEDSDFPNALKIKAFDYINQVCEFKLVIENDGKINYFNTSLEMIEEDKEKILGSYKTGWKKNFVNSSHIKDGNQISLEEKIRLFDLINSKIELPPESGDEIVGKMKQLIFVLKALKLKKTEILNGLRKKLSQAKKGPEPSR